MSGLCGIVHFDGQPVTPEGLEQMIAPAQHRGLDGVCSWCEGGPAGLAYLAREVLPPERRAQLPLVEGSLALTADLRLDNRSELTRTLLTRGHLRSESPSDAALLLAAYRCWGPDCAERLLGAFAFALYDADRRRLFAARDPMAMRPFFYCAEPERLLFASEIKQLLAAPGLTAAPFEPALGAYLAGRFDHLAWTCYDGIAQLPPGHALLAEGSGRERTWRFAELVPDETLRYRDERDYVAHLRELLDEAVRCRLPAYGTKAGVLLSGGLDSISIASSAGSLLQGRSPGASPLHAYSWAFERFEECDERAVSDPVARHYRIPVTPIPAEEAWPLKDYPAHGPDADDPFTGIYQPLFERAFAAARDDGVRLLFDGGRGDLMMGEYIFDYPALFWSGRWRTLLGELRQQAQWRSLPLYKMALQAASAPLREALLPPGRLAGARALVRQLRQKAGALPPPPWPPWLRADFVERIDLRDLLHTSASSGTLPVSGYARRQRYEAIHSPTQMHVAGWMERLAAGYGLQVADPWCDWRIARFAISVPQRLLNTTFEHKRLTRAALDGRIPETSRRQARKVSPEPLYRWALREREPETVRRLTTDMEAARRGYLDETVLREHRERLLRGEAETDFGLWWTLSVEMWLRQHRAADASL